MKRLLLQSIFTALFIFLSLGSLLGQRVNFSTVLWTDPLGGGTSAQIYDATNSTGYSYLKTTSAVTAQSMESVAVDKNGNIAFTTGGVNKLGRISGTKAILADVAHGPNVVAIDNDAEYVYAAYDNNPSATIIRMVWKDNGTVASFGYYAGSDVGTSTSGITNAVLIKGNTTLVYLDGLDRVAIPVGQIYCGLTFDKFKNLYYADKNNHVVRRINMKYSTPATTASGVPTLVLSSVPDASVVVGDLVSGYGIPANTYVGSITGTSIGLVNSTSTAVNTTAEISSTTGSIVFVTGIQTIVGTAGTSGNGGDDIAANTCAISNPRGIVFDAAGNLFVNDAGNARIRKVTATSGVISPTSNIATLGNTITLSTGASGITIDASNNLYIADASNKKIYKMTPAGVYSTVAGNGSLTVAACTTPASGSVVATTSSLSNIVPGMLVRVGTSATGVLNGQVLSVAEGSGFNIAPSIGATGGSALTANLASQDGDVLTPSYLDVPGCVAYNPITENLVFVEKTLMVVRQLVYKTELDSTIILATTLKNNSTVGTGNGQYTQSAYDTFAAAISAATDVNTNVFSIQSEVNTALINLNSAFNAFKGLWAGIHEINSANVLDVKLFPNPVAEQLNIKINDNVFGGASIKLYNSVGVPVIQRQMTGNQCSIDLSDLPTGAYFARIITTNKVMSKQFIKK